MGAAGLESTRLLIAHELPVCHLYEKKKPLFPNANIDRTLVFLRPAANLQAAVNALHLLVEQSTAD